MFPVVAQTSTAIVTLLLTVSVVLPSYEPPDVGGPSSTQGSGTRHSAHSLPLNL